MRTAYNVVMQIHRDKWANTGARRRGKDQMKGGTKCSNEIEQAKSQIKGNQAWGSCAKFTAVIWNPTILASGWRGNRFLFAGNAPWLVGISVTASLSLILFLSLKYFFVLHSAQMKPASHNRHNITTIPEQSALKTTPWGIISIVEGKKENVNW